jgi:predicted component of type VI protein secretion system
MKKVALTVAVLTLGLAACQDNAPDNNTSTVNTVETEAAADTNDAANTADNALDAAGNAVQDAGNSVDNAADAVANAADNAG